MAAGQIQGQMTIFDYLAQLEPGPEKSLQEMTGADVAEIFSAYLGVEFKPGRFPDIYDEYEHKEKGVTISVGIDTYYGEDRKFIAVGVECARGGSGAPCDSVEEAKKVLGRMIKSMKEWRRKENARRNSEREDQEPAEEHE